MGKPLHIFLAGIIQGSLPNTIHDQKYRSRIGNLIRAHLPDAKIYDPFENHPDSLAYDPAHGREVFFNLMERAGQSDIVIAFLPEASMGTAIEMWNVYHAGGVLVVVSELTENWVVRFLADAIVPDISSLETFIQDGRLNQLLAEKIGYECG